MIFPVHSWISFETVFSSITKNTESNVWCGSLGVTYVHKLVARLLSAQIRSTMLAVFYFSSIRRWVVLITPSNSLAHGAIEAYFVARDFHWFILDLILAGIAGLRPSVKWPHGGKRIQWIATTTWQPVRTTLSSRIASLNCKLTRAIWASILCHMLCSVDRFRLFWMSHFWYCSNYVQRWWLFSLACLFHT